MPEEALSIAMPNGARTSDKVNSGLGGLTSLPFASLQARLQTVAVARRFHSSAGWGFFAPRKGSGALGKRTPAPSTSPRTLRNADPLRDTTIFQRVFVRCE